MSGFIDCYASLAPQIYARSLVHLLSTEKETKSKIISKPKGAMNTKPNRRVSKYLNSFEKKKKKRRINPK